MLTRLAACFVSFGLLSGVAVAGDSANAPHEVPTVALPMRVAPDRADVKKALEKRRAKNLAAFRQYRKAGVYPHNTFRFGPMNIWMDAQGHLCAAATMIAKDGKQDLVDQIASTDNQIRLMNVKEGALLDWIMTSGFTIEEIDMIQAPMVMPEPEKTEQMLALEDAKLKAGYVKTDAWIVKHAKTSLDKAVDRLLKNPTLAWQLVDANA